MNPAFDVKSARLDALAIQLQTDDVSVIQADLQQRLSRFGDLHSMPFTLDVHALSHPASLDLGRLIAVFAKNNLRIIALRHNDERWAALAKQHRLAFSLLPQERADEKVRQVVQAAETSQTHATAPATAPPPAAMSTVVVDRPIRTGQQVYAENADLIVLALVSEGAEIIADGNIHVYGPLRGRALAGAAGNKQARIFVQSMQAELVSVAGIYRVLDQNLPPHLHHKAVQIHLQDDRLAIAPIQAA
ncbi:septum site-determining protein MinC [Paralysiella testudinis]|uniref:Probable septum site-determining protein MinC n=1 Tax=Paralysiella testudinis TaxID=2809020 RepID=A0A892ZLL8_9NEIS|nr:septum site-determining protein MinC [Paralysiella testudinis]QRQ82464.1 septum site-determining protein MinC [Paralysiella testudinis]